MAIAAVAAVIAGVFVAVSGGGDDDSDKESTSAGAPTTTAAVQDIAADRAAAEAAVLQVADLPAGWEGTPRTEDTSILHAEVFDCVGADPELLSTTENPTNADSPDFAEASTGASVQNSVAFTPTEAAFAAEAMPDCIGTAWQHALENSVAHPDAGEQSPADGSYGDVAVTVLPFPTYGDETVAFQMVIPFSSDAISTDVYFDFIVFRVGRAGVSLTSVQAGTPFDRDLEQRLAGLVATRLGATGVETPSTTEVAVEPTTSTIEDVGADYTTVTDETGLLQVDVPVTWSDVTGSSGSDGPVIQASPDREAWYNGYSTPGVWFLATTLYGPTDQNEILDAWVQDGCTLQESRQPYDDNLYTGLYDSYTDCAGTDAAVVNIAASPADGSYLVFLHVKMVDAADHEALDRIIATFAVSSDIVG